MTRKTKPDLAGIDAVSAVRLAMLEKRGIRRDLVPTERFADGRTLDVRLEFGEHAGGPLHAAGNVPGCGAAARPSRTTPATASVVQSGCCFRSLAMISA